MPLITLLGRVALTTRANLRQGSASTHAPVLRKLDAGALLDVTGLVVGETVQGNAHWYALPDDAFIWAGACGPLQTGPVASQPPAGADPRLKGFGLDPTFATKLSQLIDHCGQQGLDFRVSQGLRTPRTQALYYCQWAQRTVAEIDAAIARLEAAGAPWVGEVVRQFRDAPKKPNWQTNALPGAGWHQWGEAADCYCYRNGHMVESGSDPAYKTYADLACSIGLTPGYYFTSHQDSGHVQLRPEGGATDVYAWSHIDERMRERFGDKPGLT